MATQKTGRRTVKNLVKEFKADRVKNANIIVDIMERLESSDTGTTLSAVTGLHHVFTHLLLERAIQRTFKSEGEDSARNKLNKWYKEMFEDTLKSFHKLLNHPEKGVQELALSSLLKLLQCEGLHPIIRKTSYGFPYKRLKVIIAEVVSVSEDHRHLVTLLQEYLECQDFLFYTLLAVTEVVKTHAQTHTQTDTLTETPVTFMNNLILLVEKLKVPPPGSSRPLVPPLLFLRPPQEEKQRKKHKKEEEEEEEEEGGGQPTFSLPYPDARHALNVIWPAILNYPLTPELFRRVLVALPDLAMPHLDKPLALTGFFMESYNMGGAISLLALQGVFILINKHDLDYPDFYKKLYALLEPTVFHVKYRARFFMLCDLFLSSTHLPEYIAASFVKRLARLSLMAPSCCLPLIIKFILNLLIRFPGLKKLVHNTSVTDHAGDPYQPGEADPALTKANQSSLWEVATLQHHGMPVVSRAAQFTKKQALPQTEVDLGELVDQGYDELFERSCKVTVKEGIATTFVRPQGLFLYPEGKMADTWAI
ncbi:nucleolar complex protein 4 homolog isoform X2 [Scylla paramamosain]|uniref:nucleolar complex protein 4 homolog isoform X2 n=1 Tax=Scylla paramamosain TaxID=85552 RepID=UPI003082BAFC